MSVKSLLVVSVVLCGTAFAGNDYVCRVSILNPVASWGGSSPVANAQIGVPEPTPALTPAQMRTTVSIPMTSSNGRVGVGLIPE